jgi:hypothetical protein
VAVAAILSTARTFSGTVDEPAHIAAGLQWLTTGKYDYDLQHPPLGRIITAIGPYLRGARTTGAPAVYDEGADILGAGRHYVETLAWARYGVVPGYLVLAFVIWHWSRRLLGDAGAALATLFVATNPTVLAHAGLATTDVVCAATTTLALLAATRWIDRPTWRRSMGFGAGLALAIDSRLSAIAFLGAALAACYVLRGLAGRRWNLGARAVGVTTATMLVGIWAAYRFAIGPLPNGGPIVPAPAFVQGVRVFLLHGGTGHPSFLLGTPSNGGWWYYFPVALAVKTPIPLLICAAAGAAVALRGLERERDWRAAVPLASALAILGISLLVRVDIGVRLILPVYPFMAIMAANGTLELWRRRSLLARGCAGLLVAGSLSIAVQSYPDWLAYFNPFAGGRPDRVLVDSNLDWGQDLYRLRDTLAARGVRDSVFVAYFGTADLAAAGVPRARLLGLHEVRPGWIAASRTFLSGEWVGGAYQWLLAYRPTARIGPSMLLWHLADSAAAATNAAAGTTRGSLRR